MMPAHQSSETTVQPQGWKRQVIGAGIVLFLISQIAIPLSYYLDDEPTSERFAWRMFSSVDLSTWETRLFATFEQDGELVEREIPLQNYLQETYVKAIQKAQLDLVEPLMQQLCRQPGVRKVRYEALGTLPGGEPLDPIRLVLRPGEKHARRES